MSLEHLANTSMSDPHKEILLKYLDIITEDLTGIDRILNALVTAGVFHRGERDEVKKITDSSYQHNTTLMTTLMKKTEKAFFVFVRALRDTKQDNLANLLDPDKKIASTSSAAETAKRASESVEPKSNKKAKTGHLASSPASAREYNSDDEFDVSDAPYDVEVVKCEEGFYDEHRNDAYKMDQRPRGKALIINVQLKGKPGARNGTDIDRDNLEKLFKDLEFDVKVYNDADGLSADGIRNKVKLFASNDNHEGSQCSVLVLLCHGGDGYICGTDGGPLEVDILESYMSEIGPLNKKPKMILFQACRGKKVDDGVNIDETDDTEATGGDTIIGYPTLKSYRAWRTNKGSWYMSAVVKVFREHAHHTHAADLLVKVNDIVRRKLSSVSGDPALDNKTEMPEFKSSLGKAWYFFPGIPNTEPK